MDGLISVGAYKQIKKETFQTELQQCQLEYIEIHWFLQWLVLQDKVFGESLKALTTDQK